MRDSTYNPINADNLISPMSGIYIPKGVTLELPIDITLSGYDRWGLRFPDDIQKSIEVYNSAMGLHDVNLIDYTDVTYQDVEDYDDEKESEVITLHEEEKNVGKIISIDYHKKLAKVKFTDIFMTNYSKDYESLYIYPLYSNLYYIELYNYAEAKGYKPKISETSYRLKLMDMGLDSLKVMDTKALRKSTDGVIQTPFSIRSFGIEVMSKDFIESDDSIVQDLWNLEKELLPTSFRLN